MAFFLKIQKNTSQTILLCNIHNLTSFRQYVMSKQLLYILFIQHIYELSTIIKRFGNIIHTEWLLYTRNNQKQTSTKKNQRRLILKGERSKRFKMSRVRKFNSKILGFTNDESTFDGLTNRYNQKNKWYQQNINDWDIGPLDFDEQEELIQRFEQNNYLTNKWMIDMMSALYLVLAGLFLMLATKTNRSISCLLLGDVQSILCSCITLRYNLTNDFIVTRQFKLRVNNSTINTLNFVLLILFEWIIVNHLGSQFKWQIFLQIPLMLFIITLLIRKWNNDMDVELSELRNLKYKYKSAWYQYQYPTIVYVNMLNIF